MPAMHHSCFLRVAQNCLSSCKASESSERLSRRAHYVLGEYDVERVRCIGAGQWLITYSNTADSLERTYSCSSRCLVGDFPSVRVSHALLAVLVHRRLWSNELSS